MVPVSTALSSCDFGGKNVSEPVTTSLLAEIDSQEKTGSGSTHLGLLEEQKAGDETLEFLSIKALAQVYARLASAISDQELC